MPTRPMKRCPAPGGCRNLVSEGYCPDHQHLARQYGQERGSAAKRGYGARWRRYRERFLRRPENMLCACGCGRLSTDVDHRIPVTGPDDPKFWDPSNHVALTHECHSRKTREDMAKGLTR